MTPATPSMPRLRKAIAVSRTARGTLAYGILQDGRSAILLNGVILIAQNPTTIPPDLDEQLATEYFRLVEEYHRQPDAA